MSSVKDLKFGYSCFGMGGDGGVTYKFKKRLNLKLLPITVACACGSSKGCGGWKVCVSVAPKRRVGDAFVMREERTGDPRVKYEYQQVIVPVRLAESCF